MKGSMPNPLDIYAAPQNFVQPILPGWEVGNVYNVTEKNSGAPDTERDIVAQRSYGRQLGWVIDAVAALIEDQPEEKRAKAFQQLLKLREDIEGFKAEAAARRLKHAASDLATLQAKKPDEYKRVAAELREVLKKIDEQQVPST
jgi:hypothetical protein